MGGILGFSTGVGIHLTTNGSLICTRVGSLRNSILKYVGNLVPFCASCKNMKLGPFQIILSIILNIFKLEACFRNSSSSMSWSLW